MIFWLDAQLDPKLAAWLGATFKIIAKTIREIGLRDADDDKLFDAARRFGNIVIITKDEDFALLARARGAPPKIIWLRCGNMKTLRLQLFLTKSFPQALKLIETECCLVVIEKDGTCTVETRE